MLRLGTKTTSLQRLSCFLYYVTTSLPCRNYCGNYKVTKDHNKFVNIFYGKTVSKSTKEECDRFSDFV